MCRYYDLLPAHSFLFILVFKNKMGFYWLQCVAIRRFHNLFVRYHIFYPNYLKLGTDVNKGLMSELNYVLFINSLYGQRTVDL